MKPAAMQMRQPRETGMQAMRNIPDSRGETLTQKSMHLEAGAMAAHLFQTMRKNGCTENHIIRVASGVLDCLIAELQAQKPGESASR